MNRTFEIYNEKTKKKIFKSKEYKNSISNIKFFINGKYILFTCSYLLDDKLFDIRSNEIFKDNTNKDKDIKNNNNFNNNNFDKEREREREKNGEFNNSLYEGICEINSIPETNENILYIIKI
jgi:hypothetical protein